MGTRKQMGSSWCCWLLLLAKSLSLATGSSSFNFVSPDALVEQGSGYDHRAVDIGSMTIEGTLVSFLNEDFCTTADPQPDYNSNIEEGFVILTVYPETCPLEDVLDQAQEMGASAVVLKALACLCDDPSCLQDGCTSDEPQLTNATTLPFMLLWPLDVDAIQQEFNDGNETMIVSMIWGDEESSADDLADVLFGSSSSDDTNSSSSSQDGLVDMLMPSSSSFEDGDDLFNDLMEDPEVLESLVNELGRCGLDTSSVLGVVGEIDLMGPSDALPAILEEWSLDLCSTHDETKFTNALQSYYECAGYDLMHLIESMPSALVGTAMRCIGMQADADADSILYCVESFLGDNPLGNVLRDFYMHPEHSCGCFLELSQSVPECTLDRWPIPIHGKALQVATCLMDGVCNAFANVYCPMEMFVLDNCLDNQMTCQELEEQCSEMGSLTVTPDLFELIKGPPIPGMCRELNIDNIDSVADRYDNYQSQCTNGSEFWQDAAFEIPDDTPPEEEEVIIEEEEEVVVEEEEVVVYSETSSGRSSSKAGFGAGVVVGLVVASVVALFAKLRQRRVDRRRAPSKVDGSRLYNQVTTNDLTLNVIT